MIGKINGRFIANMERILWLYSLPYNPEYPVVCFDERPCFLIGDIVEPVSMQTGHVKKEHYAYEKNGSCALLAAIEPLTGKRLAIVEPQRTMKEFTMACKMVAEAYPEAKKIRFVLDNLNTHHTGAFYEHLPADEAWWLAQRFEFNHTPKSASWLNMIEIEFSALTRNCLNRRIPSIEELSAEIDAFFSLRSQQAVRINWSFSIDDCRERLNSKYAIVNDANVKFDVC